MARFEAFDSVVPKSELVEEIPRYSTISNQIQSDLWSTAPVDEDPLFLLSEIQESAIGGLDARDLHLDELNSGANRDPHLDMVVEDTDITESESSESRLPVILRLRRRRGTRIMHATPDAVNTRPCKRVREFMLILCPRITWE